ncbi:YmfQ family protein [Vibrio sp. 10N.286.49.E1]|uniref:YmfQ family protein n=1 Tax=Vibrio sp. 10N.286.49.E1 TaxID=3229702 RepID=UPI00354FCF3B
MGHSVEQWTNALVAQLPKGAFWLREPGSQLHRYAAGYAPRLEAAEISADALRLEMRPETTQQLLDDYETYLGLPECQASNQTFESRRSSVIEKYYRKGGLQAWNIEKLGADLGFDIEVEEIFPHHCMRGCTYPLYEEKYRHVLTIRVKGITQAYATCLDDCLSPLISQTAAILECTLNKFQLGGKYYEFIYEESV